MPYSAQLGGHAPGHLREAFLEWLNDPEQHQVDVGWYEGRKPVRWLARQLWNCSDALPACAYADVRALLEGSGDSQYRVGPAVHFSRTYAAAVRRLIRAAVI